MKRFIFVYFFAITIPLFCGLLVWQSARYTGLERELIKLEKIQGEWVESNKRLIAAIGVLSSAERIEQVAQHELKLTKKGPEEVLQIRITGRGKLDG